MSYHKLETFDQFDSVRDLEAEEEEEEEIDLSPPIPEPIGHFSQIWQNFLDKFINNPLNKLIYNPFDKLINYLSKYEIFNLIIEKIIDLKLILDERIQQKPILKPILIFTLLGSIIIIFSIIGWSNYANYVNDLAYFKDNELNFNYNLTKLCKLQLNNTNFDQQQQFIKSWLQNYNTDYFNLEDDDQFKIKLLQSYSDSPNHKSDNLIDNLVNRILKGEKNNIIKDIQWNNLDQLRRNQIKKSFKHAYYGYKEIAWGHDLDLPLRKGYSDIYQGWGAFLVDNLDTLVIMGLKKEFDEAKKHTMSIDFTDAPNIIDFEATVNKYLGGLISAHQLTDDDDLLSKAEEIGQILLLGFNSPHKLPYQSNSASRSNKDSLQTLSLITSFQMAFLKLSDLTSNQTYTTRSQLVTDYLETITLKIPNLFPNFISLKSGEAVGLVNLNSKVISYYDQLIGQFLLTNNSDQQIKKMIIGSLDGIITKLVVNQPSFGYTFVGELDEKNKLKNDMTIESCGLSGLLAQVTDPLSRPGDLLLAKNLTETCYQLTLSTPTNLPPTKIHFLGKSEDSFYSPLASYTNATFFADNHFSIYDPKFELDFNLAKSLLHMYYITEDHKYQDMGWDLYMAIEKTCKVKFGYAGYSNVLQLRTDSNSVSKLSTEPALLNLAKTLKYLYLLFSPLQDQKDGTNFINPDKFVFTPNGHIFRKFKPRPIQANH